jgi:hypothetical protein
MPCLPQNKNSKRRQSAAHLTSQLFTEKKQQKMTAKTDKQKKRGRPVPKKTENYPDWEGQKEEFCPIPPVP